jgi:hypothetical protein
MSRISKYGARLRPSPAMALAVVALVFAASGVALALPGKNSVATNDIKKNAVTAAKIKNGSVTEPKLGDGAVGTAKIGNDAVTGAKVNEATLGKVPAAGSADTAAKATSADAAVKATTAENAVELDGRTLSQLRPIMTGLKDETSQGLEVGAYDPVMSTSITLPTGGADVLVSATVQLDNNDVSPASGACRLRYFGSLTGNTVTVTLPPGNDTSVALSGFVNNSGAGLRQVAVECQGSNGDNKVQFVHGDLTVQAFPVGA